MDPLSIVSFGLQVGEMVMRYIEAVNGREEDLLSAKQQNEALQDDIRNIQAIVKGLGSDYGDATDAVMSRLKDCTTRLTALQDLIVQLAGPDKTALGKRNVIKRRGKELLYPFNRSKLQQLEEGICGARTSLQSALQVLHLAISQTGNLQRERFETVVTEKLEIVNTEQYATRAQLDAMMAAIAELTTVNKEAVKVLQGNTPEQAATRLVTKPAALREAYDATARVRTVQRETIRRETRLVSTRSAAIHGSQSPHDDSDPLDFLLSSFVCSCPRRRSLQRNDRTWWSLTISSETAEEQQHLPGCPHAQKPGTEQTRTMAVKYTGLSRLLKTAVRVSFSMRTGAGGWSISPTFTYYPTVDATQEPAFRMVNLLLDCAESNLGIPPFFEDLLKIILSKVFELLQSGKTSPRALDSNNRSLLHHLANIISVACLQSYISWDFEEDDDASLRYSKWRSEKSPLLSAAKGLIQFGVPAKEYDTEGLTPLGNLVATESTFGKHVDIAAEYIRFTGSDVPPVLPKPVNGLPDATPYRIRDDNPATILSFLRDPLIAETYGCGPLSLAVLANDLDQVENLVRRHPATLKERNIFGQTPLHLAADNPDCLRLLLSKADKGLLNLRDASGHYPLDMALFASAYSCLAPGATERLRHWERRSLCHDCDCTECVALLLDADCPVPLNDLEYILSWAPKRCWPLLAQAMRDRRQRLKDLGRRKLKLDSAEAEKLGLLDDNTVLDVYAPQVFQLLQERGVRVPDALDPGVRADEPLRSIYGRFIYTEFADVFFQEGFHDTSFWVETSKFPLYYRAHFRIYMALPYLVWLDTHGADVLFERIAGVVDNPGYLAGHMTFYMLGRYIGDHQLVEVVDPTHSRWLRDIIPREDLADDCQCACSIKGCTPLISLLKGAFFGRHGFQLCDGEYNGEKDSLGHKLLDTFFPILDMFISNAQLELSEHLACLRFLTATALVIPHTCHCPGSKLLFDGFSAEDRQEIISEQECQVQELEELLQELERKMADIPGYPHCEYSGLVDFYETTWLPRVKEAQEDLDSDHLSPEEIRRTQEIGVVWHLPTHPKPEGPKNPFSKDELQYWTYELGKIES